MTGLELQSNSILNVLLVSLLLKWGVSFTDLHTSQERFLISYGLVLPSRSTLGKQDGEDDR